MRILPAISGVMLGLVRTRVETSGKLESKCGKVARHADVVGAAQEFDDRADLALAALDRREAVALQVFERRQLQIGRVASRGAGADPIRCAPRAPAPTSSALRERRPAAAG